MSIPVLSTWEFKRVKLVNPFRLILSRYHFRSFNSYRFNWGSETFTENIICVYCLYLFFIWYNIGFLYGFVFGPQRCTILNESMTFTWECGPWFLWSNRISVWCKTFVCRLSIFFLACGSVSVRQSDFCHQSDILWGYI